MQITVNPKVDEFYFVNPDEAVVTDTGVELRTRGMTTCSALIILGSGQQLFAHVTATSNSYVLGRAITENFDLHDSKLQVYMVPGDGSFDSTRLSENRIRSALSTIGIENKLTVLQNKYTSLFKDLVVGSSGHIYEDERRIPKDKVIKKDRKNYIFVTNALPEQIQNLGNGVLQGNFGSGPYAVHPVYEDAIIGPPRPKFDHLIGIYQIIKNQT